MADEFQFGNARDDLLRQGHDLRFGSWKCRHRPSSFALRGYGEDYHACEGVMQARNGLIYPQFGTACKVDRRTTSKASTGVSCILANITRPMKDTLQA